jgi:hypothetical protein
LRAFEGVRFGDVDHGELTTLGCEGVAGAHCCFLLDEKLLASCKPFGWGNNL